MEQLRAMFIGAHNDECEYGTGGLAYLLHEKGVETLFLNLHVFDISDTDVEAKQKREIAQKGAAMLGARKAFEGPSGPAWFCNEEHVEGILSQILAFRPHLLFIHYPKDTHNEHREAAKASYSAILAATARGWACPEIYAFEAGPDQTVQYMTPDFVIDISDVMPMLDTCYHCFGQSLGDQLMEEKRIGAAFRGLKSGYAYGEAYKIIKFPDGGEDFMLRSLLAGRFCWFGNAYYPTYGELFF